MLRSQILKAAYLAGLAALAAIVSVGAARAGTIFSNFGAGYSFETGPGQDYAVLGSGFGNQVIAMPFTAGSTADLADAILALDYTDGADNNPITLDLESNSSGVPGAILGTLTQVGTIPPYPPGPVTFDYTGASVELTSGAPYWLVALQTVADSGDGWFVSNSDTGTAAYNDSLGSATGPWTPTTSGPIAAFQVDGTPVAVTAEPSSLFLLLAAVTVFGLGALWLERRRKLSPSAAR